MSRPPITPGTICIIVGALAGRECNIGAQVRVISRRQFGLIDAWLFKEASRPVLVARLDRSGQEYVTSSQCADGTQAVIRDSHLLPIIPPAEPETLDVVEPALEGSLA